MNGEYPVENIIASQMISFESKEYEIPYINTHNFMYTPYI